MTIHLIVDNYIEGLDFFTIRTLNFLVEFFIIGVTIIVVAIPEGLPLAVTIALAYSVGKMKEEQNLVRHLSACETMGGADNICTDKTGTLTLNKMNVENLYIEESVHAPIREENISSETKKIFAAAVSANSNANPVKRADGTYEQIGNKTECALLELAAKFGFDYTQWRNSDNVVRIIPFSSKRKRMSTCWKIDENRVRVYIKGATEVMLEKAMRLLQKDGEFKRMSSELAEQILKSVVKNFAKKTLRTIGVGYKDIELNGRNIDDISEDELEDKLTMVAIAGIKDPLRPEISGAIVKTKAAGITTRMVTGDIPETAMAIAIQAGILPNGFERTEESRVVMEGKDFRRVVGGLVEEEEDGERVSKVKNLDEFKDIAAHLKVLARSSPEDKFILVTGLKQLGHVVAVTGDGTNDAPALKKADIGFAMGIMGTEVAKEASGIIILDDNFNSIITAVKWGRNIFDCIRKFLQFQLTVNVVAMFMVFLGGVVLRESPFTPIQMLWVNLIMDTFASLALATEPPKDELLQRKPYGRDENLINGVMWRNILGQSIYQIIVLIILLFFGPQILDIPSGIKNEHWTPENAVHYTIVFNAFVFMQVFNEINARKLKANEVNVFEDFCNNSMFILIEFITIIVQIAFIEVGGRAIKTTPLSAGQHILCICIGLGSIIIGFLIKSIPESTFNSIALLRDTELKGDRLLKSSSSIRKNPSLKYKSQTSFK